jgi:hypothetical protein
MSGDSLIDVHLESLQKGFELLALAVCNILPTIPRNSLIFDAFHLNR